MEHEIEITSTILNNHENPTEINNFTPYFARIIHDVEPAPENTLPRTKRNLRFNDIVYIYHVYTKNAVEYTSCLHKERFGMPCLHKERWGICIMFT